MFRRLRFELTGLYLFAALLLIALVGAGTYLLVQRYFQSSTDLALQHRMAEEFQTRGLALPGELADAERQWLAGQPKTNPTAPEGAAQGSGSGDDHEGESGEDGEGSEGSQDAGGTAEERSEDVYHGDLAAIYILPLTANGQIAGAAATSAAYSTLRPNAAAAATALKNGMDWRTTSWNDGTPVRLLTYRLPSTAASGESLVQMGRTLGDQDRLLGRLLLVLVGLGCAAALLLAFASWWLAGRSLRPAQVAWERQQAFVANASHELRTPITIVRASAEVAMRGLPPADTSRRELLGDVLQECDHMSTLVEDLLLLSRLDAGRLSLDHKPVPLADLLADVQRQVGRLAQEQGVSLAVTEGSGVASADPARLRQVLLILLDNAMRHTPRGGSIELAAHPDGRVVQVSVADTGRGIDPQHLPHVFERFYRGGQGGEGSGLGLSIARALIEAQQGQISITSAPGKGTRVSLLLPAARPLA